MNKRKILLINMNPGWGGGEQWFLRLGYALKEKGYYTAIACRTNSVLYEKIVKKSNIYFIHIYSGFHLLSVIKNFSVFKPDVIITNAGIDYRLASLYKLFHRDVKIFHQRGLDKPIKNNLLNKILFSRFIDVLIVNSLAIKHTVINNFPFLRSCPIKILYIGCSASEINRKSKEQISFNKKQKPLLGVVGRLENQKNHQYLFHALSNIKDKEWHCIIVGTGKQRETLELLVKKLNLNNRITFVGRVDNVFPYVKLIDILVLPSLYEGFGISLIEAMFLKKPVIATNVSSIPEIVKDEKNGFLIPLNDSDYFAKRLETLITDSGLRKKMGLAGYEIAMTEFSLENSISKLINIIE